MLCPFQTVANQLSHLVFTSAEEALIASYHPCKRCCPLSCPEKASGTLTKIVEAVEKNPEKKWKEKDFEVLLTDSVTARRHFKRRFDMTFVQYERARRMGIAFKEIRQDQSVIMSQLDAGYDSGSGFRDAFSKIMGAAPSKTPDEMKILKASWFDSILGPMIAIADDDFLYLLEFANRRGLEREIERLRLRQKAAIIPGKTLPIETIEQEMALYFAGQLKEFKTPLYLMGSDFQKKVWKALLEVPYGQTRSYRQQAQAIGNERAFRAVANANGANQLALVVPCHRIINSNGDLGGYGGGVTRKEWLINHEKKHL